MTTSAEVSSPIPVVPDTEARDEIRTRLDATLFVEAGAGTGKTTALVARLVELVRSGTEMRRIAAITFTEAAAAELRDRVRRELEAAARAGEVPPGAVAEVDEAAISTLHSFAQRILAEHPLEAGLPPALEVLDEIQSELAFDERWHAFVDELLDDPSYETVLLRSLASGLRLEALRDVARLLHDHRDRIDAGAVPPARPRPVELDAVLAALSAAVDLRHHCVADDDHLAVHLEGLAGIAARLSRAEGDLEVLHVLEDAKWGCGHGQRPNWPSVDVDEVRTACAAADAARQELLARVHHDTVTHLLYALSRFTLTSAGERRQLGRLSFHDLLVEARDLLRSRADVRRALRQRYSHLLIDEFQDTDPLQVELAVLIAAPESEQSGPWSDVRTEPGRLFFVGDAKQSIYRFRRADISLFLDVRARVADAVLDLVANFRSAPGIVEWVNAVFGALIGEGVEGAQARYEPLLAVREPLDAAVPVVLLGEGRDELVGAVREREAADIADAVHRIVEQEFWTVSDPAATDGRRPAQRRDIAVLLPTRTSLPQLEAAFEDADIPFRVESSSLVWSTQEVRDLLAVLQAVDDPTDEVALVAALRSPVLACTDADLLEFRQAGGRWNLRTPCPEALTTSHPVCRAVDLLRDLHDRRWWEGVAGIVERVARELRFFELAFAHPRPRDHWRRLRFVLDQALAFEEAGGRTLRQFVEWAEQQSSDDARVREPVLADADDDAVRILTIHGAKGLEFPIVFLTGLNRQGWGSTPAVLWDDERPEGRLKRGFETLGYRALADAERAMAEHEQTRLLYVAATRARDHLLVSVHHRLGQTSQASRLGELCTTFPQLWRRLGPPLFRLSSPPAGRPPRPDPDERAARQRWAAERDERVAQGRRAPVMAATAVAEAFRTPTGEDDPAAPLGTIDEVPPEAPPWRKGRAGTAVGRAVHATLQTADLRTGEGIAVIASAQAAAEGVDAAAADIARLATAALRAPSIRAAVDGRHWRELYVAAPIGSTLVEGFVDLVAEAPDGSLVVIDYKTDQIRPDRDLDMLAARYRLQVAAYASVLEASLGRTVSRAVLVFLAGDEAHEREVPDLAGAMVEVRRHVAALAAP